MPEAKERMRPPGRGERIFQENIRLFEEIAVNLARRHGLKSEDVEDFRQDFLARLFLDTCKVLENFKGLSSLKTYIVGIASKFFIDFRASRLGRWRPSTMANSLGPLVVDLERMIVLEGRTADEAIATLSSRYGGSIDVDRLPEIVELLPARSRRRLEGEESLAALKSDRGNPHATLEDQETAGLMRRLEEHLPLALETLEPEELVLLKLTLLEEMRVSELARSWNRDDQELYRIRRKALKKVRIYLEERQIMPEEIRRLLDADRK